MFATPTTLIVLLRAVACGWREQRLAENAAEISALGKTLHERLATLADHFAGVGKGLDRAVDAYNKTVGALESRVLVAARRFKELGAASGAEIAAPDCVDTRLRELPSPAEEAHTPESSPS
jgi:DNA recombination protein RmuC